MRSVLIAGVLAVVVMASGCMEAVVFRGPQGAPVYVNDTKIGTAPVTYKAKRATPFDYRIGEKDCIAAEGRMGTRVAPGRVTGTIFTLGFLALIRLPTIFEQDFVDGEPCTPVGALDLKPVPDGSATVAGQAFLRTRGGDVKTAAGLDVFLCQPSVMLSVVSAERRLRSAILNKTDPTLAAKKHADAIADQKRLCRRTIGDANGGFAFRNVSAGVFVVGSNVTWEVPSFYGLTESGGWATAEAAVSDGETVNVIATSK